MLSELVTLEGRNVVDIGCGSGALVRWLTARGACAVGVEISAQAVDRARSADPARAGDYLLGRAQALPLPDGSVDLAIFWRSLHHVPADAMAAALTEARRVLRADGLVYVAEPLPQGDLFELLRRVDDETAVRELARRHVAAAGTQGLACQASVEYEAAVPVAHFANLRASVLAAEPGRQAAFDDCSAELRDLFRALAEPDGQGWSLRQPMRVDLLRRVE